MKTLILKFRGPEGDVRELRGDSQRYLVSIGKSRLALSVAVSDLVSVHLYDDEAEALARERRQRLTAYYDNPPTSDIEPHPNGGTQP